MFFVKLFGAILLGGILLAAGFFGDMLWNDGRLFYAAVGRDRLVELCTPPAREDLISRGFSPTDLVFAPRPSIAFTSGPSGQSKTFSAPFTFSDGPNGQRVDGRLACSVSGKTVKVDVQVDSLPLRAA
ncbi:hypothetical protein [Lichenifustis flavocetrariae]|uniref:Uncharacterized protein n=1 Tax=Lichenifustis flavocetrariae TaxID=2949735 RepID=A0AA42CM83_9HYPH|nr:hypothetical protein [Lichenifustis flavocetrariae]MCW6508090.1 hypothetical protein [Lichenifustis flavocetrariae]